MPHPPGKKEAGRARVLASAGQGFRRHGYGGAGIDALAKQAGVTSGAFYAHFPSKAAAFAEAIRAGMDVYIDLVETSRREGGDDWVRRFVDEYLGYLAEPDLGCACTVQTLTPDVARADEAARQVYKGQLDRIIDTMIRPSPDGRPVLERDTAIALVALLAGGVSLARAVPDPETVAEIEAALRRLAGRLVGSQEAT